MSQERKRQGDGDTLQSAVDGDFLGDETVPGEEGITAPTERHPADLQSARPLQSFLRPTAAPEELPPGIKEDRQLGHYVLVRKLGEGGMGVVYVAVDTRLNREVALKLLHTSTDCSEQAMASLLREARALAQVSHPNVVGVYEIDEASGTIFIAMELIKGVSLREWMTSATRPLAAILDAFIQAGAGLHAVHRAGLVHRDFKPENVMMGSDGRVKVVDFGIAFLRQPRGSMEAERAGTDSEPPTNRSTELVGTLAYMSPERFKGGPIDARSDQFSFCVALFEAIFGENPAAGRRRPSFGTFLQGSQQRLASARTVPSWLGALVMKGLSGEPERRFPSMLELTNFLSAGRRAAAERITPRSSGNRSSELSRRLECTLEEVVTSTRSGVLLRARRSADGRTFLVAMPRDTETDALRQAYRDYHRRAVVEASPALRPTALIDEPSMVALVFDDCDVMPLGELMRHAVEVDLVPALRICVRLTESIQKLARLGCAVYSTEAVLVGIDDYAALIFDPCMFDAPADAEPGARYRVVGDALVGMFKQQPELDVSVEVLSDGALDTPYTIPEQLHRMMHKLADPGDGYRSARGLAQDLQRCIDSWLTIGDIATFPLGEKDVPSQFVLSKVVRGRHRELDFLHASYERVAAGACEAFLVSGPSGIGKTTLLDALSRRVAGRTITGKFNQFGNNEPYSSIIEALRGLVLDIAAAEPATQDLWRSRILSTVEPNAALLINLIPDLRALLGEQPPVADLPPAEASLRFEKTLKRLLYACAQPDAPLLIVLDDMQWCDPASVDFICSALADREGSHILWLCALRDADLGEQHPLAKVTRLTNVAGGSFRRLVIGPLSRDDITEFLVDTLACSREAADALGTFIEDKTDGNPLFVRTLVESLHDQGLIAHSPSQESWSWSDDAIRSAELPGDVAALITRKIDGLSEPARHLLTTASCIGRKCETSVLLVILGDDGEASRERYSRAIEECIAGGLLSAFDGVALRRGEEDLDFLIFTHDRVQQAAHNLLGTADKQRINLAIGKILLKRAGEDISENIFRIVDHLNAGGELATDDVRSKTIELNLLAGKQAMIANAFADSSKFLEKGLALLPADSWESDYERTIDMHLSFMHAESLLGHQANEDSVFEILLAKIRTPSHLALAYERKVMLETSRGEHRRAIAHGVEGLQLMGENLPQRGSEIAALVELAKTWWLLRRHSIHSLFESDATVQDHSAVLSLLVSMGPPAYLADNNLMLILLMRIVRRSLARGITKVSSYGFVGYGLILGGLFGRYERARELGDVARRLDARFNNSWLAPKVDLVYGIFILPWIKDFRACEEILQGAMTRSVENADLGHASYIAAALAPVMYYRGVSLDAVGAAAAKLQAHGRQARDNDMTSVLTTLERCCACLRGETASLIDLSSPDWSERDFVAALDAKATPVAVFFYRAIKIAVLYLHDRADLACALGEDGRRLERNAFSNPSLAELRFYHAMSLLRQWPAMRPRARWRARSTVRRILRAFRRWAASCPANFGPRYQLIQAELSRVHGRGDVLHHLNGAIEQAIHHGSVQFEAIGAELAARFCRDSGHEHMAMHYRVEAHRAYVRWGAMAKATLIANTLPNGGNP